MNRQLAALTAALTVCLVPVAGFAQIHDPRALEADPLLADDKIAPVLEGLGDVHLEITTGVPEAQRFFDQGLRLTYGFNHSEALRAFKEAARLDFECAMAYWGWALVLGPNINLPMQEDVRAQAWEAMQEALALREQVTARERAFIDALAVRYSDPAEEEEAEPEEGEEDGDRRRELDEAYAEAMKKVYEAYPEDSDAATLYAASLMNLSPWSYWYGDGTPRERTTEIMAVLEGVLERDPRHTGALHYYIHTVEEKRPQRAEAGADRLATLAPNAGHLVHMPAHIYMRLGRYQDSFDQNAKAVAADEGYITSCKAQGVYPLGYYPHNIHFMVWSAMLEGRSAESLELARKVAEKIPEHLDERNWDAYEYFRSQPLYVMVRFGLWDEVLAEPQPIEKARYMTGIWHHARALAYLGTGSPGRARKELRRLGKIQREVEEQYEDGYYAHLLTIARLIVEAELEAARGRHEEALPKLEQAVRLEGVLGYSEPPDWHSPVRHLLGAALIEAGRPAEAEVVYWADLAANPENGFSLFGLEQSLRAQERDDEADAIAARFEKAWARADVELVSSRY
jgi:tetratricopeptide (TPR) repeat protein